METEDEKPAKAVIDYLSSPMGFGITEPVSSRLLRMPWKTLIEREPAP